MLRTDVTLDDKYILQKGRIYVSGVQALVRLAIAQSQRDRSCGLNTGGFISGYRGSPLGMYDKALWLARDHLDLHHIHFQPSINEDLAATSIWGTQQVTLSPHALVQGVFAIWYGKGPGVDRSLDVLKHGNAAGSSKYGGVLVVVGDDHNCESSTLPHQSEQVLQSAMIPILNPATVQEYIDFGLYGFALSRFSGCWVGLKAIAETVGSSATISIDPLRPEIVLPDFDMPQGGLNIRWPDPPLDQERRLHGPKIAAVNAFVRANPVNRIVLNPSRARLGIITTGKTYLDVRQAFEKLGLDDDTAMALGIRLYKVGLTWPLEPQGARDFANGLQEVLVVEEKRDFVEQQLVRILYGLDATCRPAIVGKTDEHDAPLLPSDGELTPAVVARAIVSRLTSLGETSPDLLQRFDRFRSLERNEERVTVLERTPFFCSGCPHNTSTVVPEGSRALAGIGCHGMAMLIPDRRTTMGTHMGGEGATWIGQSPFSAEKHVFQNLGDGTFQHSGSLAIRAAAISGANITYKILYNDAVGMTGGQPVEGRPSVAAIAREVSAEGAKKVVVVTDDPVKYRHDVDLPHGVQIHHRDYLDRVQKELRDIAGLTVLIYDQTCAAELRRRRRRGHHPEPARRVFINEAVCEDCGDCSTVSNCISLKPVETEFGRKRAVDQSSCNKDFSCLKGFCPSFVTVQGNRLRRRDSRLAKLDSDSFAELPQPASHTPDRLCSILITGIGGSGIVTLGALLGMAAHLERKGSTVLDCTGVAQKNGAVTSHVRISNAPDQLHPARIGPGEADVILGCDLVVAANAVTLDCIEPGKTRSVVNSHLEPTAAFVADNDLSIDAQSLEHAFRSASRAADTEFVDATNLATVLTDDSIFANVFLLGYACQRGLLPVGFLSLERAIEMNGVEVDTNKGAFMYGRLAAHDRTRFDAIMPASTRQPPRSSGLAALVEHRATHLSAFQDDAYARHYRDFVNMVFEAEKRHSEFPPMLAEAVAENLFKLMAYKDEYEVARLHTDGVFLERLKSQFEGDFRLELHLALPLLARRDPETGHSRKRVYGPWMFWVLAQLAKLKWLRRTRFDPFGRTAERRVERRLIAEYEAVLGELIEGLTPANHRLAVEVARIPEGIRGFGHVKQRSVEQAKAREAVLLGKFRT